jgi:hypothetical protein
MQEAQSRGLSGSNPAKTLAQNPALVRQLTQYTHEVEDVLSGDWFVLAVENTDFTKAAELQRTHGLLTNDSLNLSAGARVGPRRCLGGAQERAGGGELAAEFAPPVCQHGFVRGQGLKGGPEAG